MKECWLSVCVWVGIAKDTGEPWEMHEKDILVQWVALCAWLAGAALSACWEVCVGRDSPDPAETNGPGGSCPFCAIGQSFIPSPPDSVPKQKNRILKLLCYQFQRNKNFSGAALETPGT